MEKKDKLQVSYEMFRDSLKMYQCTVKKAKEQYYSDLISSNAHRPKVLFNTINSILIPASTSSTFTPSNETCEQFSAFFNNKVEQIRAGIVPPLSDPSDSHATTSHLQHFQPVSCSQLTEVVQFMKPTYCPLDILPHFTSL